MLTEAGKRGFFVGHKYTYKGEGIDGRPGVVGTVRKGDVLELSVDDGSAIPKFITTNGDELWIHLDTVEQPEKYTEKYTESEIRAAMTGDVTHIYIEHVMKILKETRKKRDPEYQEFLRLKEKFGE